MLDFTAPRPGFEDRGVRRDTIKLVRSLSPRLTREALERLRDFDRPTLLAWTRRTAFLSCATPNGSRRRFRTHGLS
jgi:hypothetical protein